MNSCDWEQLYTALGPIGVLCCVSLRNEMQLALDRPWLKQECLNST